MDWKCRIVELNGKEDVSGWIMVEAHNPQRAAVSLCQTADMWEACVWEDGHDAVVEVESFGHGPSHKLTVVAYNVLDFSATPVDQ